MKGVKEWFDVRLAVRGSMSAGDSYELRAGQAGAFASWLTPPPILL